MKKIYFIVFLSFFSYSLFSKDGIVITKNDSTQIIGTLSNYGNRKILISSEVLYFIDSNGKEQILKASELKSFIVNKIDYYETVKFKEKTCIAQLISKGKYVLYEIILDGDRRYLMRENNAERFIEIRKNAMKGIFNYYFRDCPSYKDTTKLLNKRISYNSISLAKELVQYHKCIQQPNEVFVKDEKADIYGLISSGIQLMSLRFAQKGSELYQAKSKVALGYYVGFTFSTEFKKRVSIDIGISYVSAKATYTREQKETFPVSFSYLYKGNATLSGVDVPLSFKVYFLTKKLAPYGVFGALFSYRVKSQLFYTKTSTFDNQQTSTLQDNITKYSAGINIGLGLRYKVLPSFSISYELGYKKQLAVPVLDEFSENHFYTGFTFAYRFNNPEKRSKIR